MTTSAEILSYFQGREMDDVSRSYLQTHAKRFAFLLDKVRFLRERCARTQGVTILDIGPSFFTEVLRKHFSNDTILTLGFDRPDNRGGHFPLSIAHEQGRHFHFDLNDAQCPEKWIAPPRQAEIVLLTEVLEHLHTAPTLVLTFVRTLVQDGGYLVIQTPNAASLKKRVKLVMGRNPYEMIRETAENPGHFREYTRSELLAIAHHCQFAVRSFDYENYFSCDASKGRIERLVRRVSVPSLRRHITMVVQK